MSSNLRDTSFFKLGSNTFLLFRCQARLLLGFPGDWFFQYQLGGKFSKLSGMQNRWLVPSLPLVKNAPGFCSGHNSTGETQHNACWLAFVWESQWWFQLKIMRRRRFWEDSYRGKWCPTFRSEVQPHSIGTMILSHLVLKQWRSRHCTKVRQSNWYRHQLLWWNVPQRTRQHLSSYKWKSHSPKTIWNNFWGSVWPLEKWLVVGKISNSPSTFEPNRATALDLSNFPSKMTSDFLSMF